MAAPETVSLQVYKSAAWQDATPHVRAAGGWHTCKYVWTRVSGNWKITWADISGELKPGTFISVDSFDTFAPYLTYCGVQFLANGRLQTRRYVSGTDQGWADVTDRWKVVDVGRTYHIKWAEVSSGSAPLLDTHGMLENTWYPLTSDRLIDVGPTNWGYIEGQEQHDFYVYIREDSTPTGSYDTQYTFQFFEEAI